MYMFVCLLLGEFQVVNQHLLKDLTERGLWGEDMKQKLIAHNGSVQVRGEGEGEGGREGGSKGRREGGSEGRREGGREGERERTNPSTYIVSYSSENR